MPQESKKTFILCWLICNNVKVIEGQVGLARHSLDMTNKSDTARNEGINLEKTTEIKGMRK
jgi:hypothetical protein